MIRRAMPILCLIAWCASARAQLLSTPNLSTQQELSHCYIEQRLLAQIPPEAAFIDDRGQPVHLGNYFGDTPVLLVLGYFSCPDLCPMAFGHLTEELNGITPVAGRDFQVVIISFDPRDTPASAASQKRACVRGYKSHVVDGWHFLTGSQPAVDSVTSAVGFHYTFDRQQGRFIHPTGVMVLTPSGTISHYFFGIDASPADMESALRDASANRSSRVDQPEQVYCASYDPTLSARGKHISRALDALCIGWVAILFGYIGYKFAGDVRHKRLSAGRREATP